jgi:phage gp29-like protein
MNPLSRLYTTLRSAAARAFGPRPGGDGIVVVRRPDKRPLRQLPAGVGAWDRTFEEVQSVISAHEAGRFRASGVLADVIERNPRIFGALNNRALGVIGSPFSILPGLGDRRRAAYVARTLEEDWPTICPEETAAELVRGLVTMGFVVCRVRPITSRGRWVPTLETWHPSFVRWDATRRCLVALTEAGGEMPITPGDGWFLLAAQGTRPWMRAVVRCLGLPAEVRKHAVKDWARWSEKHGLPLVELQVPASKADSADAAEFFAQMRDLVSDTTIVSPQGDGDQASFKVNLIEARDTAWEGFKELIGRNDGDVSIAIEGQNLSTENSTVGAKASSQTGHTIRQDLREADAWILAVALHEQVIRTWSLWNFGDAALAPWAVFDPTPPEDRKAAAEMMKAAGDAASVWRQLAQASGRDIDLDELAERFGVPLISAAPAPSAAPSAAANDAADEEDVTPEEARARASARRFLARRRRHQPLRVAA